MSHPDVQHDSLHHGARLGGDPFLPLAFAGAAVVLAAAFSGCGGDNGGGTGGNAATASGSGGATSGTGSGGSTGGGGSSSSSSSSSGSTSSSSGGASIPCGMVTGAGTGAVFDLGHVANITKLREANGRLLSQDGPGRWVLWDLATKSLVARGGGASDVQIAGAVFAVGIAGAVELRDAGDGHLIASIALGSSSTTFGLAMDGSYIWARSPTDIQVWSATGVHLFTHPGSYASSVVFAAPGQLRIGDPSLQTIEYVDAASGTSTTSPTFAGTFFSWFNDGERFFSVVGSTVRIYSKDAVQAAITSLPTTTNLTGQGDYFWTYLPTGTHPLSIYTVAQPANPVTTLNEAGGTKVFPGGNLIGVLPHGDPNLTIVHLDPGGVSTESVPVPSAYLWAFGADSAGNWSVGTKNGVVYDRANLLASKGPLSCGKAFAVDGASTGLAAVGTDGGGVLTFQAGSAGFTFQGAVPYKGSRVQVSADGTVLAVQYDADAQYWTDMSLRVFSLPGATEIHTWPLQYDPAMSTFYKGLSLARGGTRIGQVTNTFTYPGPMTTYTRTVTDLAGSTTTFMDKGSAGPPFVLSPDGTLVAAVDVTGAATQIFKNGALVGATSGIPSGWLDDDRLLVQFFTPGFPNDVYAGTAIHSVSAGTTGATMMLHCTLSGFGVVDANHVFCEVQQGQAWVNTIYDLSTNTAVWTGSSNAYALGAVAGGYVIFTNDHGISAEAYTVP